MGYARVRLIWVTALAVSGLAAGTDGPTLASATRVSASGAGPWRAWGAPKIRSLDAPVARPADSPGPRASGSPPRGSALRQSPPASLSPRRPQDEVLSNETTFTRWAYVFEIGSVHRRPASDSARVVGLHWYTEDGFPEIYLVRRAHWDGKGQEWVQVCIPMRPNGQTGWVPRQDLGAFHITHTQIVVDRARLRMYLYDHGRRVWSAPAAVGKPSTPTPPGYFWIRERFKIEDPGSGYWPYAFGTSDYSTLTDWPGGGVVGIHGPYYQAWAIPGRISHGCIRLRDADDAWLADHIGLGTPLRVR